MGQRILPAEEEQKESEQTMAAVREAERGFLSFHFAFGGFHLFGDIRWPS